MGVAVLAGLLNGGYPLWHGADQHRDERAHHVFSSLVRRCQVLQTTPVIAKFCGDRIVASASPVVLATGSARSRCARSASGKADSSARVLAWRDRVCWMSTLCVSTRAMMSSSRNDRLTIFAVAAATSCDSRTVSATYSEAARSPYQWTIPATATHHSSAPTIAHSRIRHKRCESVASPAHCAYAIARSLVAVIASFLSSSDSVCGHPPSAERLVWGTADGSKAWVNVLHLCLFYGRQVCITPHHRPHICSYREACGYHKRPLPWSDIFCYPLQGI